MNNTDSVFKNLTIDKLPELISGYNTLVPTMHGDKVYINFDNAASTPTFSFIEDELKLFMKWYSNVHRGTGFKSQLSSWAFDQSRNNIAKFVGADLDKQIVLFTKNSTEAINKLARKFPLEKGDIVLTSFMEHHSNELPWRNVAQVEHIGLNSDGTISIEDFQKKLTRFKDKIKLVAITGASNVTGYITDLDYFATETHKIGAKFMVDGAQLAPHRPIDLKHDDKNCCIDYFVLSAHKMYAPYGVGVLIADKKIFEQGDPEDVGGGVVDMVTLEEAYWADLPEKEEAGTPDIVGVVALSKAIKMIQAVGWDEIIRHESELTAYAIKKMSQIPQVTLYGDTDIDNTKNRLGVVSFNIEEMPHALVGAILSYEGGIGIRDGCFCAHMYVKSLVNVSDEDSEKLIKDILNRNRSNVPGTVRMSFGIYNTTDEIDWFIEMINKIVNGDYFKEYQLDKEKGSYKPKGYSYNFEDYYQL